MNPLGILKLATTAIVSIGAGSVVGNAIKTSVPIGAKPFQKVSIAVGGFVLSNMAGDLASAYVSKQLDSTVELFRKAKTEESDGTDGNQTT